MPIISAEKPSFSTLFKRAKKLRWLKNRGHKDMQKRMRKSYSLYGKYTRIDDLSRCQCKKHKGVQND